MQNYKLFYSPYYSADIGEGHVFPIRKFEMALDRLIDEGTLLANEIVEPEAANTNDLLLVHTEDYITRLIDGRLTPKEIRKLGLPCRSHLCGVRCM